MGATTVLMATGIDLKANVRGVIADSAFTSPEQIIYKVGTQNLKLPSPLFMPELKLSAKIFIGISLTETVSNALKKNKIPVLFIHGTDDELVPYEMAKENFKSGSFEKRLVSVKGATHGFSCVVDTELVRKELLDFIKKTS